MFSWTQTFPSNYYQIGHACSPITILQAVGFPFAPDAPMQEILASENLRKPSLAIWGIVVSYIYPASSWWIRTPYKFVSGFWLYNHMLYCKNAPASLCSHRREERTLSPLSRAFPCSVVFRAAYVPTNWAPGKAYWFKTYLRCLMV